MASYKARKLNSCPLGLSPVVSRTAKIINNSLFLSHGFTTWPRRAKSVFYRDSRACPENFITVSTSQAILRILKIHTTHFREFLAIISFSARGIRKESSRYFWPTSYIWLKQLFLSPSWPLSQWPIRPSASWAIASGPIQARGIIVK